MSSDAIVLDQSMPLSRVWEKTKDRQELIKQITICDSAAINIDDPFAAVNVGIFLKEAQNNHAAEVVFRRILEIDPDYVFALFELGIVLPRNGKFDEAAYYAGRAASKAPRDARYQAHYAAIIAMLGDGARALRILERFEPTNPEESERITRYIQLIKYLAQFPVGPTLARFKEVEDRFLTTATVRDILLDAVASKRPFALLRMADGEGSWTFMSNSEEAEFSRLFRSNRSEFLIDWFGSDALLESDHFHAFAKETIALHNEVDILGLPAISWARHEYGIISERGIPSCLNILRRAGVFEERKNEQGPIYCSSNIHVDLKHIGFFPDLWRLCGRVGVITSFPGIPDQLRARGVDVGTTHLIPGDSRNFWRDGAGMPQCQYPDRVNEIMHEISQLDLHGVVYLVAAGFVGKRYCLEVRRRGGLALDIGALANQWGVGQFD